MKVFRGRGGGVFFCGITLACMFIASVGACGNAYAGNDDYRIGPGDILSITVFGESDLSVKQTRVGANGSVSFPILGEIMVNGFTPRELERRITGLLRKGYLKKPDVTVSIIEYRMFYVSGEVKKPGGYKYVDGLTVQKALALAGGLTERASDSKITLVRESAPEKPVKRADKNLPVMPGDFIIVGESIF